MSAKPKQHIFARSKPLVNIYSKLDRDGKEVEVREDAEQQVKYHEIVEALVGAGYYRAQLQALSAFDKIVGGMTWCIELCDIDVDVNLLFEENLTIGKKISLTEKIVAVLPSIQCPYSIEPHQIQGLDFINIYPLIQWLIKYSDEFREAKEDELRRFAVLQYDKNHLFDSDRRRFMQEQKLLKNLFKIQNMYKPCRVRKRKGQIASTELEQVNATLSEYDQRMLLHSTSDDKDSKDEGLELLYDYEKTLADPSRITTLANRYENFEEFDSNKLSERKMHYAILQSELTGEVSQLLEESEKAKYIEELEKVKSILSASEKGLSELKHIHLSRMEDVNNELQGKMSKLQILSELGIKSSDNKNLSTKELKHLYRTLQEIVKERDELIHIIKHKNNDHSKLQQALDSLSDPTNKAEEEPPTEEEIQEFHDREVKIKKYIGDLRLELARVNREVLGLTTAIDEVPGQAELLQYERRFIELYNQVAAKHKETKQFYTFYNTLYEVKLYITKELSLLNSILENYEEAMSSSKKREQFMSQLESIVEWVKTTVRKVELKHDEERDRKSRLSAEHARLRDVHRQYTNILKKLADERRKYK